VDLVLGEFVVTVSVTGSEDIFSGWISSLLVFVSLSFLICFGVYGGFKLGLINITVSIGVYIIKICFDFSLECFSLVLWNILIDAGEGLILGKSSISIRVAS